MDTITGQVESVYVGAEGSEFAKESAPSLQFELDGIVGDRHRGLERECWDGDKQAKGTVRRNERQWSAISVEELDFINDEMNVSEALTASDLGVNLCFKGIADLSQLTKGTTLLFPSGAELQVEEYNPPCPEMGEKLTTIYKKKSGEPLGPGDFSKASKFSRGIVGVVEVPGVINVGDSVTVKPYQPAPWLQRLAKEKTGK